MSKSSRTSTLSAGPHSSGPLAVARPELLTQSRRRRPPGGMGARRAPMSDRAAPVSLEEWLTVPAGWRAKRSSPARSPRAAGRRGVPPGLDPRRFQGERPHPPAADLHMCKAPNLRVSKLSSDEPGASRGRAIGSSPKRSLEACAGSRCVSRRYDREVGRSAASDAWRVRYPRAGSNYAASVFVLMGHGQAEVIFRLQFMAVFPHG